MQHSLELSLEWDLDNELVPSALYNCRHLYSFYNHFLLNIQSISKMFSAITKSHKTSRKHLHFHENTFLKNEFTARCFVPSLLYLMQYKSRFWCISMMRFFPYLGLNLRLFITLKDVESHLVYQI